MIRSTLNAQWWRPEQLEPSPGPGFERTGEARDRLHVAIIMDGNGRWAEERGRPRAAGHVAGASAVRRAVEAAPGLGITTLTLYAFSSDNWRRPPDEVDHLMRLFGMHLDSECERLAENGVRLSVIGRRDRIPEFLGQRIAHAEERTREGTSLHLRIAIDYSSRDALRVAAGRVACGIPPTWQAFERSLLEAIHAPPGSGDVDLLIRTGREQRLSDFMLWESAYAELYFTDVLWPDFDADELARAVEAFDGRDRRYGALPDRSDRPVEIPLPKRRAAP